MLLCVACPARPDSARSPAPDAPPESSAWLDPQARISSAVRLTGPPNIDVREGAYWRPTVVGRQSELATLIRTRDFSTRDIAVDPQRVAVLNLADGRTERIDPQYAGTPFELAVSADHAYAAVTYYEPDTAGHPRVDSVAIRCYGYGVEPVEVLPQPVVLPVRVATNGDVYCRLTAGIGLTSGLPAPVYDWNAPLQVCDVPRKLFRSSATTAIWPAPRGTAGAGYVVDHDPALPARARSVYTMSRGSAGDLEWRLPYYVSPTAFAWQPPLVWLGADVLATVAYRAAASGPEGQSGSALFRIVTLSADGLRLVEDRVDSGVSLLSAPGVLFYTRQSSAATPTLEVWAASADGLEKQRIWHSADSMFVELLDNHNGRRLLVHRQFFDTERALRSEVLELSLDPLVQTVATEPTGPLPSPTGVIEEAPDPPRAPAESLEPSSPPPDAGDLFIPDRPLPPGDGPPPIAPL